MRHRMKCNKENKIDCIEDICSGVENVCVEFWRSEVVVRNTDFSEEFIVVDIEA